MIAAAVAEGLLGGFIDPLTPFVPSSMSWRSAFCWSRQLDDDKLVANEDS